MVMLVQYLAAGLRSTLDEAMREYPSVSSSRRDEALTKMETIIDNMIMYRSQGVPIPDDYFDKRQEDVRKLRDNWSI